MELSFMLLCCYKLLVLVNYMLISLYYLVKYWRMVVLNWVHYYNGVLQYDTTKKQRTVVECDNVKTVHQLPLVLMDTLHLTVKHGVKVDPNVVALKDVVS